jgi:RNA polymerase-binding transcription factor DksA
MTKDQLAYLERRLKEERTRIADILRRFQADAEQDEARDQSGDLSGVPTHPADLGTDQQQREVDDAVARREAATLAEIDAALERLYRDPERFGRDEQTGEPIPFARLDLIPWARTNVAAGSMPRGVETHERRA